MKFFFFFNLILLFSASLVAEQTSREGFSDFELGGGYVGGTHFREEFDGEQESSYQGLTPLFLLRLGSVYISNTPVKITLDAKGFRFGTLGYYGGDSYEVTGVDKKNDFFIGGFIGYKALTFYTLTDVTSTSSGTIYTLRYSPLIYSSKASSLHLVLKLEYMNTPYVDYYFGVNDTEVSASPHFSSTYLPKKTLNYESQLFYSLNTSENSRVLTWVGLKDFGSEIANSPTVKSRFRLHGGIGWLYRFF